MYTIKKKKILIIIILILISLTLAIPRYYQTDTLKNKAKNYFTSLIRNPSRIPTNHIAILEIEKLNLKQAIYPRTSEENTVAKNVELIEKSTMPDQPNSNFILAAHSGNTKIAYFKNLDELTLGDTAKIYYNNQTYTYQLINIYPEEKDGNITIRRQKNKSHLTLITCSKTKDHIQDIYILELIAIT